MSFGWSYSRLPVCSCLARAEKTVTDSWRQDGGNIEYLYRCGAAGPDRAQTPDLVFHRRHNHAAEDRRGNDALQPLEIVARAHYDAEIEHLSTRGADHVVMGEREMAEAMLRMVRPASARSG
jgi:hypothetical protein